jgi:single-stranded-DNA-specific exonuclease
MIRKRWCIKAQDEISNKVLTEELNINPAIAQLLINRNIKTPNEAALFLKCGLKDLHSPSLLKDIDKAVGRIKKAMDKKEMVLVYGDYDVDGITATALLVMSFSKMGLKVHTYIPNRLKEGYGISKESIKFMKEKKISLVITVDCGISSIEEVGLLNELGIDVIITDHHYLLNGRLPDALAIINPFRGDCSYPFKLLSGVGVAFKLIEAVYGRFPEEHMDLVCLGTIADVVPLIGENRILAKCGLVFLNTTSNIGIRSLIEASGLSNKEINEMHVGFMLGPRINSTGRLSNPNTSLELLLTPSKEEALRLSDALNTENRTRQKIVEKILKEALLKIEKEVNFKYHKVLVLDGADWHAGVIGIVASRIAERFFRPTIIISSEKDICKGSGRSVGNFHLVEALSECEGLLNEYGGHKRAAGFSILKKNIEPFRNRINEIAEGLLDIDELTPRLDIDMDIGLGEFTPEFIEDLKDLAPYGGENPAPLFLTKKLFLKTDIQRFGRDNIKMWVSDGTYTFEAIGFGISESLPSLIKNDIVDLVYAPAAHSAKGEKTLQFIIKDLRY